MAQITCSACQEALIWYSAGSLPAEERHLVAEHLETCADCRQELAQWQAVGAQMRRASATLTPPRRTQIWQGIQEQIADKLPSFSSNGATHMEFEEQPTPSLATAPIKLNRPRRRSWFALVATLLVVALAVGVFAVRTNARFGIGANGARAGEHPLTADVGSLRQVKMVSPDEGWAIGWRKGSADCSTGTKDPSPGAPMLHYHDGAWWEVNTPYSNHPCATLEALDMLSPDEGWAVGYTIPTDPNQWTRCFAMHYIQGAWHDAPINDCLGVPSALYASGPDDIWMIGGLSPLNANVSYAETYGNGNPTQGTMLLMHYDGHTWQHIIDPTFTLVAGVTIFGSSSSDVTTLGTDIQHDPKLTYTSFIAHYDGHAWTRQPSIHSQPLFTISLISAHEGWALSDNLNLDTYLVTYSLVTHYHDGIWDQPVKLPTGIVASSIAMTSATDGWAVGDSIVHYSNGTWTPVVTALPKGHSLTSIAMTSATEGWAVGSSYGGDDPLIMHYSNGAWTTYFTGRSGTTTP